MIFGYGTGMAHEIREVQDCIGAGKLQSLKWPLSATVKILDLMDTARSLMGVEYPSDENSVTLQQAAAL